MEYMAIVIFTRAFCDKLYNKSVYYPGLLKVKFSIAFNLFASFIYICQFEHNMIFIHLNMSAVSDK